MAVCAHHWTLRLPREGWVTGWCRHCGAVYRRVECVYGGADGFNGSLGGGPRRGGRGEAVADVNTW